jgi:hypothetical protein
MSMWGLGPFENDGAGDFLVHLGDTPPPARAGMIRRTMAAATTRTGWLDFDGAGAAIAAAAIVAHTHGAPDLDPKLGEPLTTLPPDLVPLALEVLDRVTGFESEWRDLLAESGDLTPALAELDKIRSALPAD